jgi:hypothetical protein
MNQLENIHSELLNDAQRLEIPARLFGLNFPMKLEPTIYRHGRHAGTCISGRVCGNFYTLSNGGFYMAPASDDHL